MGQGGNRREFLCAKRKHDRPNRIFKKTATRDKLIKLVNYHMPSIILTTLCLPNIEIKGGGTG